MDIRWLRTVVVTGLALALLGVEAFVLRPWFRTWGATPAEVAATLPGDELWPESTRQETRAVTIAAPPEFVWQWVAQLGQDKGGFYSYDLYENLFGAEMRNAERVLGIPDPQPGERFWMAPPTKFGGIGYALVARVLPGRALVLSTHEGTDPTPVGIWTFVAEPDGHGATRLIAHGRSGTPARPKSLAGRLADAGFYEPAHFIMERGMLLGLKARAEGAKRPAHGAEGAAWLALLALAVAAGIATIVKRDCARVFSTYVAACLSLVLPLAPPPAVVSVATAVLIAAASVWALFPMSSARSAA